MPPRGVACWSTAWTSIAVSPSADFLPSDVSLPAEDVEEANRELEGSPADSKPGSELELKRTSSDEEDERQKRAARPLAGATGLAL